MTYIIYGAPGSGSGIVEAACAEIGVDYELRDLCPNSDEHRGEAYAAINLQRKMSTLEVDGELITETVAILLTLDERHRHRGLLPPPASKERAQALRWMIFMATELHPLVEILDHPERFASSSQDVAALLCRVDALWQERWQVLESHAAGSPYFLDNGFSATDLYTTVFGLRHEVGGHKPLRRTKTVMNAVLSRKTLASVWARHIPRT